ncbi:MAG: thermonuclease family protein [Alphaproteobacteria bacterium]|nr:thermonuclease family protein [Alphaproteobacteria bacterium]
MLLTVLTLLAQDARIIDGDTVEFGNEMVRIENIDTPERGGRAECDAERMLAEIASDTLTLLLSKGAIEIERSGTDRYGRTLARISVSGRDIGEELITRDLAVGWEGRRHDWCGNHQ